MAFNTNNFKKSPVVFTLKELDPDVLQKDPAFPNDFKVKVFWTEAEAGNINLEEMKAQKTGKDLIIKVLQSREKENIQDSQTQKLMFGDPDFDDRDEILAINLDGFEHSDVSEGED